jgi:beta-amylase
MPKLGGKLSGVPVYVMLPLDTVGISGELSQTHRLWMDLEALKNVGVAGVVVDVWWGVVGREGLNQYDWKAYVDLVQMVESLGLRLKMVLSFHGCKNGDSIKCDQPITVVTYSDASVGDIHAH